MDMSNTIEPKSDQINADSLTAGPITIKVTKVSGNEDPAQPVNVFFEGDNGKPYRPCKSMRRVLVNCWGPDAHQYIGRSMTLYRDPEVSFGGMKVGGIRISHVSHIDKPQSMALTASKAKRAIYTVKALQSSPAPSALQTDPKPAQDAARAAAANGKAAFTEWWKANRDCHALVTDIMDDLKALTAKADAPVDQGVAYDDEPPL